MDIKYSNGLQLVNGSLVTTESLADKVRQRLFVRLRTFINTWFLNLDYGVDYFGSVFGKGRTKAAVDAIMRIEIEKEKYVGSISSFSSTLVNRQYSLRFSVNVTDQAQPVNITLLMTNDDLFLTDQNGNILAY